MIKLRRELIPDDNKIQTPDYDPENPRCDQEQLKFLKECIAEGPEGIEKWNKQYEIQGYIDKDTKIWLQKTDLSGAHLEGVNLIRAHLEGVNLIRAHLERADLRQIHLERADLRQTHLERANLKRAHLEEAHLEEANLMKAHLEGANLSEAHLEEVWFERIFLKGTDLGEAHLEGAELREAHLKRANLKRAHLEGANLSEANLEEANLSEAHLERANLEEAHLEGANLIKARLEKAHLWKVHLEEAYLSEANLEEVFLVKAHLEGANLSYAHLEYANLSEANLEEANFCCAHLKGANFLGAHLEGADLEGADLRRVNLSDTFLQRTNCRKAIVDGETLIWGCKINKRRIREKNYTDFAGVGLDSARIQPQIKQLLEYNIRKSNWCLWYEKHPKLKWLVKPFWLMSDYGMSTWRIILTFLILAIIFATVYFTCGAVDHYYLGIKDQPGIVKDLFVPVPAKESPSDVYYGMIIYLRSIYFSVVTMTTLGFGDMYANTESFGLRWWFGHLLLIVQVIFGYVLLGALVTRFAVLFTAGGPAGNFAEKEK